MSISFFKNKLTFDLTQLRSQTWDRGSIVSIAVWGSVTSIGAYKHTMLVSNIQ